MVGSRVWCRPPPEHRGQVPRGVTSWMVLQVFPRILLISRGVYKETHRSPHHSNRLPVGEAPVCYQAGPECIESAVSLDPTQPLNTGFGSVVLREGHLVTRDLRGPMLWSSLAVPACEGAASLIISCLCAPYSGDKQNGSSWPLLSQLCPGSHSVAFSLGQVWTHWPLAYW